MESSVHRPSSPNTYSYVREEKCGVNKKIGTTLFIVYVYFQPNSCNTHGEHEWARGTFLRQRRKVPPAHAQRVFLVLLLSVPKQSYIESHTYTYHRCIPPQPETTVLVGHAKNTLVLYGV